MCEACDETDGLRREATESKTHFPAQHWSLWRMFWLVADAIVSRMPWSGGRRVWKGPDEWSGA